MPRLTRGRSFGASSSFSLCIVPPCAIMTLYKAQPGEMGDLVNDKIWNRIWIKRKTVILVTVVALMAALLVVVVDQFREITEEENPAETVKLAQQYSASRYFFRVGYPSDWEMHKESHGFFLNEDGLVLELYPLIPATPVPAASPDASPDASPLATPKSTPSASAAPTGVRDESATVSFYHYAFEKDEEGESPAPSATPSLSAIAAMAWSHYVAMLEEQLQVELVQGAAKPYQTARLSFLSYSYSYETETANRKGICYIAARELGYYLVVYEADATSYAKYQNDVQAIMADYRFAVFEDY